MNNKHIQDLTFRLSHALDQNYDVVNLDAVMSVISALEGATITKEQLEATRLAKYINQLRRRTKSEQLARRAKSLLKRWREMVGIQQQTNESLSNPNTQAATTNSAQQQQKHYHRSQPTSPIVGSSSMEHGSGGAVVKLGTVDFLRSTVSNPATMTSFLSGSANNNKRLAVVGGANLSSVPMPTVPANGGSNNLVQPTRAHSVQKQPTSFANLLTAISSSNSGGPVGCGNMPDLLGSPSFHKSNKRKERNSPHIAGIGGNINPSPCSNAAVMRSQLPIADVVPIVIDIQDSNSGSNIIGPAPTTSTTKYLPIAAGSASTSETFKAKKPKKDKDKKRKDRDLQQQTTVALSSSVHGNITNVIDDSCSNHQRPNVDLEFDNFVPMVDNRSSARYPAMSGISEILSLSNSSMSSMFPNSAAGVITSAGGAASSDQQNKQDVLPVSGSSRDAQVKTLSMSDLTFAGKFRQHTVASSSDLFGLNGNRPDATYSIGAASESTSTLLRTSALTHTFVPFSGSVCNSNDSTSNSRTSQFDIIDVVNQDNSQSKIIDELRQQHKKQTNSSTPSQQQYSQQKTTSTSGAGQMLMPPTLTSNLRQLYNAGESNVIPTTNAETVIPKKRGRKKGSKGVDSVIAKETSLCSQMLMTTLGCKKVKTTKELYTEMQNRKLGVSSTTSSPTLSNWLSHQQLSNISRPNSSCSEPSLHSPRTSDACSTNATISTVATRSTPDKTIFNNNSVHGEVDESDSETNTSDPSRDSATAQGHLSCRPSTDSNSNSQLISSKLNALRSSVTADSLKNQLKEMLSQMPPVPAIDTIEWNCHKEVVPCTCKVIECDSYGDDLQQIQTTDMEKTEEHIFCVVDINKNKFSEDVSQQHIVSISVDSKSLQPIQKTEHKVETKTDNMLPPPQKPKKSIFDLDFDDDEDPLHQLRAEAATKPLLEPEQISNMELLQKHEDFAEVENVDKLDMSLLPASNTELALINNQSVLQEPPAPIIFPTYTVEEDPKCVAKQRYEIQIQEITKFHIAALHNCYIPNINGNWDNAETNPETKREMLPSVDIKAIAKIKQCSENTSLPSSSSDLWTNVVPQYGSLISEYIPKNLSHVLFTPNFVPKKCVTSEMSHFFLPFLGVAKKRTFKKTKQKEKKLKKNHTLVNYCEKSIEDDNKDSLAHCRGDIEPFLKDGQDLNIKIETNNNNDHVYVKFDGNHVHKTTSELQETQIKLECIASDNSNNNKNNTSLSDVAVAPDISYSKQNLASDMKGSSSNIVYSGITIDIAEDIVIKQAGNEPTVNYNHVTARNLLTIAKIPDNSNTLESPQEQSSCKNSSNYQLYQNQNDQNINNNIAPSSGVSQMDDKTLSLLEDKNVATPIPYRENHVNSRRSSSCSNSSLKQNQNSINLKLRRRRLEQQEQDVKISKDISAYHQSDTNRKRKKCENTDTVEIKKRGNIKRIKIAFNGNFATQRQISLGSSNNSTDEDEEELEEEFENSAGSRSSQFEDETTDDCNVFNEDAEDDEYVEEEYDDEEDDEDDEYAGDYHEVVTRNMSATSTGNNHIVLTIKKTPSKTNSPSDSLSAISPVIMTHAQVPATKSLPALKEIIDNTTQAALIDTAELDLANEAVQNCENDVVEVEVCTEEPVVMDVAIIQDEVQSGQGVNDEDITSACAKIEMSDPTKFLITNKCRRKRKIKKPSKCASFKSSIPRQKLHHQLFFPYELQASAFGVKERIFNISSCSSSCGEESVYSDYSSTEDDNIQSSYSAPQSTKETLPNEILIFGHSTTRSNCSKCSFSNLDSSTGDSSSFSGGEGSDVSEGKISEKRYNAMEEVGKVTRRRRQRKKKTLCFQTSETEAATLEAPDAIFTKSEHTTVIKEDEQLPLENNGLLQSFNNIYITPEQVEENHKMTRRIESDDDDIEFVEECVAGGVVAMDNDLEHRQEEQQQRPKENCDVYSNFYNNKNNSKLDNSDKSLKTMVRSNSSNNSGSNSENVAATASNNNIKYCNVNNTKTDTQTATMEATSPASTRHLVPHKEYRTGLRAVDEDVDDEEGNNCARIQQFKEWYQVLQLRSYNDELLTVLPYVVLE